MYRLTLHIIYQTGLSGFARMIMKQWSQVEIALDSFIIKVIHLHLKPLFRDNPRKFGEFKDYYKKKKKQSMSRLLVDCSFIILGCIRIR